MKIKVKSLQGAEYVVEVQNDETVLGLKSRVSELANGLPVERLKLVYKGRTMQDSSLIFQYNLEEGSKIHLIVQKESQCPAQPMDISSSQETNTKIDINPNGGVMSHFEAILKQKLLTLFPRDQVDRIVENVRKEINEDISSSSLDDLERLAKQKLNISNE